MKVVVEHCSAPAPSEEQCWQRPVVAPRSPSHPQYTNRLGGPGLGAGPLPRHSLLQSTSYLVEKVAPVQLGSAPRASAMEDLLPFRPPKSAVSSRCRCSLHNFPNSHRAHKLEPEFGKHPHPTA